MIASQLVANKDVECDDCEGCESDRKVKKIHASLRLARRDENFGVGRQLMIAGRTYSGAASTRISE